MLAAPSTTAPKKTHAPPALLLPPPACTKSRAAVRDASTPDWLAGGGGRGVPVGVGVGVADGGGVGAGVSWARPGAKHAARASSRAKAMGRTIWGGGGGVGRA